VKLPFLFSLVLGFITPLLGTPVEHVLNPHLTYLRLHLLPSDLPSDKAAVNKACILDLRNLKASDEDSDKVYSWVRSHASSKTPVVILENEETSFNLVIPYKPSNLQALGVITIGPKVSRIPAEIQVAVSSVDDHKAYDAFESGTRLEALITPPLDKVRDDEERLSKEHNLDSKDETLAEPKEKTPIGTSDLLLIRAYGTIEGLFALKRLN